MQYLVRQTPNIRYFHAHNTIIEIDLNGDQLFIHYAQRFTIPGVLCATAIFPAHRCPPLIPPNKKPPNTPNWYGFILHLCTNRNNKKQSIPSFNAVRYHIIPHWAINRAI